MDETRNQIRELLIALIESGGRVIATDKDDMIVLVIESTPPERS